MLSYMKHFEKRRAPISKNYVYFAVGVIRLSNTNNTPVFAVCQTHYEGDGHAIYHVLCWIENN